mmetsp:Transcript_13862/g.20457  ORF Transcript_13862/g.20457 Transcript_13862/m.20457 type:complete len:270 (+) Transcript_13862:109-918(+)|eukprot:CAMPEP_0194202564 /NCGR_PEP_ID=MMETSP0156-20130528/2553_1 /TAXON_ID=33649 /ORGANISM="Thalassionema nitzschioides, Strain L26-B" /LENGTH=269 /DNA_ID=CAMNT_0038928089 /DNA_START=70 /DNA_END=879 /DNA_ORIENTATION=-
MGKKGKKRSKKTGKKKPTQVLQTNEPDATAPNPDTLVDIKEQESDPKLSKNNEAVIANEAENKDGADVLVKNEVDAEVEAQVEIKAQVEVEAQVEAETNVSSESIIQTTLDDSKPIAVSSENEQDNTANVEKPTVEKNEIPEPTQQKKIDNTEPCVKSLDDKKESTSIPEKPEVETSFKMDQENKSNDEHEAIEVVKSQSGVKVREETSQSDDLAETTKKSSPPAIEHTQDAGKTGPPASTPTRSLTAPSQQELSDKGANAADCPCVIL